MCRLDERAAFPPPSPRPLARPRPGRAVRRAGAPAPSAGTSGARLRPARAAAGADRRGTHRDGQPLPAPARARGGGARLLGVGRLLPRPREAPLRDHTCGRTAARPLGRGAAALTRAHRRLSRTVRGEEVKDAPPSSWSGAWPPDVLPRRLSELRGADR